MRLLDYADNNSAIFLFDFFDIYDSQMLPRLKLIKIQIFESYAASHAVAN